jgi:hypothetical protein
MDQITFFVAPAGIGLLFGLVCCVVVLGGYTGRFPMGHFLWLCIVNLVPTLPTYIHTYIRISWLVRDYGLWTFVGDAVDRY